MNLFFFISKNNILIERKIKEISKNYTILSYKNNFKDFILELQKKLNKKIFGENQDIVFKNLSSLKEKEIDTIFELIKKNKKLNFIFVFDKEPDNFLSYLRKNKIKFQISYFQIPKGIELEKFIEDEFKKIGLKVHKEFIFLLKENYQENFDNLLQALEKIKILKNLSLNELKNFFHFQTNSFKIHDAFLEKNWTYFIHSFKKFILEDKSSNKIETLKTFNFLFNSLIKIYLIKVNKKTKISGHYFYIQKLKEKSKNLNINDIKNLIFALAQTERKFKKFIIKSEEIPEDIYYNYLLNFSQ